MTQSFGTYVGRDPVNMIIIMIFYRPVLPGPRRAKKRFNFNLKIEFFQLINSFLSCSLAIVVPKPLLTILPALIFSSYESDFRNLLL